MREILFRGKRVGNGKWIDGSLLQYPDGDCFICCAGWTLDMLNKYEVEPETIGQYIGLTDEKGKKIFKGDVVQAHFRTNHTKQIFQVVFDDGMFLFDNDCVKVPKYDIYAMKVIGNIHDNPELIGGADNGEEEKRGTGAFLP